MSALVRLAWGLSRPDDAAALANLPDQREYRELGRNLASGEGLWFPDPRFGERVYAFRTPGYPALIALCGGSIAVTRIAQALIDTSTALAVWILARRWLSPPHSLIAAAAVAANPFLVFFSGLILSETLFTAMLAWALVLVTRPPASRGPWAAVSWLAGIALAAASVHVRPSAIGLPALIAVLGAVAAAATSMSRGRRLVFPPITTGLALTVLALAPWAWRNHRVLGAWVWTTTNSGVTAYDGFNPDATGASDQSFIQHMPQLQEMNEVERSHYLSAHARQYIRAEPRQALRLVIAKLGRTWSPVPLSAEFAAPAYAIIALAYAVPLDVLAVIGLWRGRLPRSVKLLLLAPAIYLSVVHLASVGSLRYRIPAEPALAVIAAAGAGWLIESRRDSRRATAPEPPEPATAASGGSGAARA